MSFTKKAGKGDVNSKEEEDFGFGDNTGKVYTRDKSENKLFKDIQVQDISSLIDEDTLFYYDFDTPIYKICSNLETKQIKVTLKSDKSVSEVVKNITTFRGRSTKNISENSWLGIKNVDRELLGKEPWGLEDFTVEEFQTLKYDSEDEAFEQAKKELYKGLKKVRAQYLIENIKLVIGSGDNFRNKLPLCRPYKGNRDNTLRPLMLKRVRQWVVSELGAVDVKPRPDGEMIEADDYCEFWGAKGIESYRKTGKFKYGVIASDKDAMNSGKLLINADLHTGEGNPLRGKFKFPKPMLIQSTDKCVGDLELVIKGTKTATKEVKGYGFKFLMYQALLGQDQADNYNAISHLGKFDFGDLSAYQALKPCTTPKECIEKCLEVFTELLPKGVQYYDFEGNEHNIDTMSYMDMYFRVAYMTRSEVDSMDFYKLCNAFKVDYSHLVDNHIEKVLPLAPEDKIREVVKYTEQRLEDIGKLLLNQKGKKDDLTDRMTEAEQALHYLTIELQSNIFVQED